MNYQVEISESIEYLRQLERATKDLKARDRVRFIGLLKIGKATTQAQAGALVGLQVRQSQRLWKQYREGGLSAMCQSNYVGGQAKLSPVEQEQLRRRLRGDDIGTLEQARRYLKEEFAVDYTVGGVSCLFQRMKNQTENRQTDQRQTRHRRTRGVCQKKYPLLAARFGERIYWEEEMRYGTRTTLKRRWTPQGHRPNCPVQIAYEFGYLYCAICPFSGDLFCLLLPNMKKECFQIFIEEFENHLAGTGETLLILDGAGCHQADTIKDDSSLALEKLPPACPELNPAERFFQELRKELANQVFETIKAIEEKIKQLLENYWKEPNLIIRLTSFPYINTSNSI